MNGYLRSFYGYMGFTIEKGFKIGLKNFGYIKME